MFNEQFDIKKEEWKDFIREIKYKWTKIVRWEIKTLKEKMSFSPSQKEKRKNLENNVKKDQISKNRNQMHLDLLKKYETSEEYYNILRWTYNSLIQSWVKKWPAFRELNSFLANISIEEFKSKRMWLEKYSMTMNDSVNSIRNNLDYNKIWNIYWITNNEQKKVFKSIVEKFDSRSLLAYWLTELMPSYNWNTNIEILENMLQKWWTYYIHLFPAIHDKYASFWLYQFTQFAVYDTPKEKRWASVLNQAIPKDIKIPWSTIKLTSRDDQHKAAILFALHNTLELIKRLNVKQIESLDNIINKQNRWEEYVEFIATAHHSPSWSMNSAERWLDNKWNQKYSISLPWNLTWYAKKTKSNRLAIINNKKVSLK